GRRARRPTAGRRFRGLRFFLFRAEPLHQDAEALLIGQQAGALVGPRLVRNRELVAPDAAIGSAERVVVLAPAVAAARVTGRRRGALVAVSIKFEKLSVLVAV